MLYFSIDPSVCACYIFDKRDTRYLFGHICKVLCLWSYFMELQINVGNTFLILIWIVTLDINTYLDVILTPAELPSSCNLQYP